MAEGKKALQLYQVMLLFFLMFPLPAIFAGAVFLLFRICDVSAAARRLLCGLLLAFAGYMVFRGFDFEGLYTFSSFYLAQEYLIYKKLVLPSITREAHVFLVMVIFVIFQVVDLARIVKVPEQIKRDIREKEKNTIPLDGNRLTKKLAGKQFDTSRGALLGATRGGEPFFITPGELNKHCALVGTTGSGKTTTIYRFVDYAMRSGQAGIFVDGKGDPAFRETIGRLARKSGREIKAFSMDSADGLNSYNPFAVGTPSELTDKIIALTDWSEEHYKLSSQRFLQLLFRAFKKLDIVPDLAVITRYCNIDRLVNELANLNAQRAILSGATKEQEADPLADFMTRLPAQVTAKPVTDEEIIEIIDALHTIDEKAVQGIASRLGVLSEGDMRGLISRDKAGIDISKILANREIAVFSLDSLRWPEQARLMGRLIINDLKACIADHQRHRGGERVSLIFDEFNVFASSSVVDLVNKSRAAGFEALLSFQSLADIGVLDHGEEIKNQIIQNCNTLIVQRQNASKDAEELAATFGTKDTFALTIQTGEGGSTGMGSARSVKEFVFHPDEIKRLQTGEALVKRNIKGMSLERVFILPLSD